MEFVILVVGRGLRRLSEFVDQNEVTDVHNDQLFDKEIDINVYLHERRQTFNLQVM